MGIVTIAMLTLVRIPQAIVRNYDPPERGSDKLGLKGEKVILWFYGQQLICYQDIDWYADVLKDWLVAADPVKWANQPSPSHHQHQNGTNTSVSK